MSILDIFKSDAFGVMSLTDAINKQPFVPGRAGAVIDWAENGIPTTSIAIEEYAGVLSIVNPSARGGPGTTKAKNKRTLRNLSIPHYEINDGVMAEEVQGVREFGSESSVQTVQGIVNMRMGEFVRLAMDPTLEYQRMGAVKGIILNGDGSTLYNLFTEFGVAQPTEVDFDLDNATPASGALRKVCTAVLRTIADALGGVPYRGVYALCSDAFWDDLIAHPEVRETYKNQVEAPKLREGVAYEKFEFGGITFENYRGSVGATPFITASKCHVFPVGVPGLWRTVYAPADYIETVNTIGLPRYARQYEMPNGKGVNLDLQTNALNYCTRPGVLVQGKRT